MPIIDGGRNRALEANANAQYEEAVADYRQSVLLAFQEVEDSLSGLRILPEKAGVPAQSIVSARRAAQLSTTRYRAGYVNYIEVIDAERSVLGTQRSAVQIERERALATVSLIRALGGGWTAAAVE